MIPDTRKEDRQFRSRLPELDTTTWDHVYDALDLTAEQVLRAYKRQPIIEKRFSQLKTDFNVAPILLKSVTGIQALLCMYFFGLMLQTLLERVLRQALQRDGIEWSDPTR